MANRPGKPYVYNSGKILLVNPNPPDREMVNLEDLSISVELETFRKGRSILTTIKDLTTIVNDNNNSGKISFINGSTVDGLNSLTTNYTELNTNFNKKNKDLEGLGITNINIDFNSSYAPMVSIDFIDIRGSSILEQGSDGKYAVFFELPYPIFKLTVKGFYGQPVAYYLHLTNWSASFNSQSGNFEIHCDFIGYTYAFLTDMLMGYLRGIVETPAGSVKFNELKANRADIITINELIVKVAHLNETVTKLKTNNATVKQLAAARQAGISINTLSDKIGDFINNIIAINGSSGNNNSSYINTYNAALSDSTIIATLVPKFEVSKLSEYINLEDSLTSTLNQLISDINTKLDEPYRLNPNSFVVNRGFKITNSINIYENYSYEKFGNNTGKLISINPISIEGTDIADFIVEGLGSNNIKNLRIYDLDAAAKEIKKVSDFIKKQIFELDKTVSRIIKDEITADIGFTPTIKNIIEIFTIHVEVFIQCLKDTSIKAENEHKTDILQRLLTSKNSDSNNSNIYPWPLYATESNNNLVETFIGTVAPNIPEVNFVNDLINGMIQASQKEQDALQSILSENSNWYPITLFDNNALITTANLNNPYASVGGEGKLKEIIRLVALRACAFLSYSNGFKHIDNIDLLEYSDSEISLMARLEADNLWSMMKGARDTHNGQLRQQLKTLADQGPSAAATNLITALLTGNLNGDVNAFLLPDSTKSIITNIPSTEVTYYAGGPTIAGTAPSNSTTTTKNNFKYNYLKLSNGTKKVPVIPVGGDGLTFLSNDFNTTFFNGNTSKSLNNMTEDLVLLSLDKTNGQNYISFIEEGDYTNDTGVYPDYADKIFSDVNVTNAGTSLLERNNGGYTNFFFFNGIIKQQELFTNNTNLNNEGAGKVYLDFYSEGGVNSSGILTAKKKSIDPLSNDNETLYNNLIKQVSIENVVNDSNKFFRTESDANLMVTSLTNNSENTIEDIIFSSREDGKALTNFSKLSLFGSEFYYFQGTDYAKAYLFLSSIPFKTTLESEGDIIKSLFNQRSGFINTPKSWVYYIGGVLWRASQSIDPITWVTNFNRTLSVIPLSNDLNDLDKTQGYHILIQPPHQTFLPNFPLKNQLLSGNAGVGGHGSLLFTDGDIDTAFINISDTLLTNLPVDVKNMFIQKFKDWVDESSDNTGSWKSIKNKLEIIVNPLGNWESTWNNFINSTNDLTYLNNNFKNINNYDIISPINVLQDGSNNYTTKNYFLNFNESSQVITDIFSFLNETIIIANSTPTIWNPINEFDFIIPEDKMQRYFTDFFKEILSLNKSDEKNVNNKEIEEKIFNSIDDVNIQLNMYRNIKAIYDKWIAGVDNIITLCGVNDENGSSDHLIDSFRFIDKSFKDIGDDFLLNPSGIINYLSDNFNQSFYDIVGRILADNNFDFIALPTFVNIRDSDSLVNMFTATPHNSALSSKGPTFICMYANRANKLDLGNSSTFSDAGFNFNLDSSGHVTAPKGFDNANHTIPVFAVNYGEANQSIFKDLKLNQKEFSETDESLTIIDNLTKANTLNNRASVGQNLFNIYSVRSYSCEIEALGNAMIQPMMYFQLNNIPMFRGAYLITRVSHKITANHMATTFKGVRIAGTDVPLVNQQTLFLNLIGELSDTNTTGVVLVNNSVPVSSRDITPDFIAKLNFGNPTNTSPMTISSHYGAFRKASGSVRAHSHNGLDIALPNGSNITAIDNGTIDAIHFQNSGAGLYLVLKHKIIDGKKFTSNYFHLSSIDKKVFDFDNISPEQKNILKTKGVLNIPSVNIKKGDIIGLSGGIKNTEYAGDSHGPHLHLEIYEDSVSKDPEMLILDGILGKLVNGRKQLTKE